MLTPKRDTAECICWRPSRVVVATTVSCCWTPQVSDAVRKEVHQNILASPTDSSPLQCNCHLPLQQSTHVF